MKAFLTLLFGVALSLPVVAQLPTYKLDVGQSMSDVLSFADFYRYPAFLDARVQFRDGYVKATRMNLNFLSGKLEFIAPKGDTLELEGLDQLAHVAIGTDTFFFYGGGAEQVGSWKGLGRMLQLQQIREEGTAKVGGYDGSDPASAVESVTRVNAFNQTRSVAVRQRTTYIRDSKLYFWKDDAAEPVLIDRKAIERLFPKKRAAVSDYLRLHKVDYRIPGEVKALFDYLYALS